MSDYAQVNTWFSICSSLHTCAGIYIYIYVCHLPKIMPKTQSDYSYHVQDVAEALALLDMRVFNMARMHGATERPWGLGIAPREMWFHRILKVNEDMYKHI